MIYNHNQKSHEETKHQKQSRKNEQKADLEDLQRFQMLELLLVHFKKNVLYQSLKN